jgi:hypothetical protein
MSMVDDRAHARALLRGMPSFRDLRDADLERIAVFLRERSVDVGEAIVVEGDAGDESYLVVEGAASVTTGGAEIARVGEGEFVGELALLTDTPRCATVTALTPMRVLVLDRAALESLVDPVTSALLGTLARRARHAAPPGWRRGASVAVRSRFGGDWVKGFEIADLDLSGATPRVQVLRHSDGALLPVLFDADDVRLA